MKKLLVALAAAIASLAPLAAGATPFHFTATFQQQDPFSGELWDDAYSVDALLDASLLFGIEGSELYLVTDASGTVSNNFNDNTAAITGVGDGFYLGEGSAFLLAPGVTFFDFAFQTDEGGYFATLLPGASFGAKGEAFGPLVRYSLTPLAAGVPEPATWGLMILGFGAVGGALRRRGARLALA